MKAFWNKYIRQPLEKWWASLIGKTEPQPDSASDPTGTTSPTDVDAVPFASFDWAFGGFDGGHAVLDTPRIGSLSMNSNGLSYSWTGPTLSEWGLGSTAAGALACLFLQRPDGTWVGGKFDWISTSRTSRSFNNINDGYKGWTLSGIPQACQAAFCIVDPDGRRRTNVIHGTWSR